jgi:serine/threonine protein kinase
MTQLHPGEMLGPYQIVEQIGKGGMATVYKAFHAATNRFVAVKILPGELTEQPQFIERFRREAQTIANLQHPRILPVHDYGENKGILYLVMRYLESGTLQDRMRERPLTYDDITHFLTQLLDALGYAHEQGVIHRDIKPANALIDRQDNLFLTDFGIAKILDRQTQMTETGVMMGTPGYMSPEQAQGLRVDHRSDIYSLGIILYEMTVGRLPYEADTPLAVALKQINEPLPPPSSIKAGLPMVVEAVILKSLAKIPENRFSSCAEFQAAWKAAIAESLTQTEKPTALDAQIATTVSTAPAHHPSPQSVPATKRSLFLWIGVVAGVAMICILAVALVGGAGWRWLSSWNQPPLASESDFTRMLPNPETTPRANTTELSPLVSTLGPTSLPLPVTNISNNDTNSSDPNIFVDGEGVVHVIWLDHALRDQTDVFYRRLKDGTWSDIEALSGETRDTTIESLGWVEKPDKTRCAWFNSFSNKMYFQCLKAGGWSGFESMEAPSYYNIRILFNKDNQPVFAGASTSGVFANDQKISKSTGVPVDLEFVVDATGNFHILWVNDLKEDFMVYHSFSTDSGQTWQPIRELNSSDNEADSVSVIADSRGGLYAAWTGFSGSFYICHWTNSEGWEESIEVSGGELFNSVALALDADDQLHIAGYGRTSLDDTQGILYWQPDGEMKWKRLQVVREIENSSDQLTGTQIVVDQNGGKHLTWKTTSFPQDIYYLFIP